MVFRCLLLMIFFVQMHADENILSLGNFGSVRYIFENQKLLQIDRISEDGAILYTHKYNYSEDGKLSSESFIGNLGEVIYSEFGIIKSPYHLEVCEFNEDGDLIRRVQDGISSDYFYNEYNELISADSIELPQFDFYFNTKDQLVRATSQDSDVSFTYNSEGLRDSKTVNGETKYYTYFGINEFAIYDTERNLLELRIPGASWHPDIFKAIAIESHGRIFAPIHDIQGNIVKLIDINSKEVISLKYPDPYGRNLSKDAPTAWIFAGKNYDPELDLVYFGGRYYSPTLKEWLTPDPAHQSSNPYLYCLGNPLSYFDPDGNFAITFLQIAWGAGLTITSPIWGTAALATAGGIVIGYIGYEIYDHYKDEEEESIGGEADYDSFYLDKKMDSHKLKEGKQKDGIPKSNIDQNKQADAAKKEIEKKIGKKLTKSEEREFHDHVTGQNYGYHELVEEGYWLFYGRK